MCRGLHEVGLHEVGLLDFWSRHPPKEPCPCPSVIPRSSVAKVLDLVVTGRPIAQIAADLNISDQAIYGWCKQEVVDTGRLPRLNRDELAQLSAADVRIREVRTEVAILKRARDLLRSARPKAVRGHSHEGRRRIARAGRLPASRSHRLGRPGRATV